MFTILRIDAHATADRMPTEYAALAASGRTDVVLKQADAETPEQLVAAAQEADVLLTDCAMLTGAVLQQHEAFAHFFEANMGGGIKLQQLRRMFPRTAKVFDRMLEAIINSTQPPNYGQRERDLPEER